MTATTTAQLTFDALPNPSLPKWASKPLAELHGQLMAAVRTAESARKECLDEYENLARATDLRTVLTPSVNARNVRAWQLQADLTVRELCDRYFEQIEAEGNAEMNRLHAGIETARQAAVKKLISAGFKFELGNHDSGVLNLHADVLEADQKRQDTQNEIFRILQASNHHGELTAKVRTALEKIRRTMLSEASFV